LVKTKAGIIAGNAGTVEFFPLIAAFVNRSGKEEIDGHRIIALLRVDKPKQWKPEECIPAEEIAALWQQAQQLLAAPQLARFFDAQHYRSASNEMPYVNSLGELKRIDRLVEFDDEVWVLDYKLGDSEDAARYRAQMQEYRTAMQTVYAGKTVRCALLFADGQLSEM